MKKISYFIFIIIGIFCCIKTNALALQQASINSFNYTVQQKANNSIKLGYYGVDFRGINSSLYEFIDINGNYNIVYSLKDNSTKLGWITLSSDLKTIQREIYIDAKLSIFGNAIYKDGYLYAVYGDNTANGDGVTHDYDAITLEVVKYDSNGNIVADLPLSGKETSIITKTNTSQDAMSYGTARAFDSGNCDIAINNGIMRVLFNKEMYNGHTMSYNLFIDTSNLDYLNRPSTMDNGNKYYSYINNFLISHSFEERVIATSDGGFLSIDQGDAYPRSLVLTKGYDNGNGREIIYSYDVFRFREGFDTSYGYNKTFASAGNLVELSDGYLFVATSEKTLSLNYAPHETLNESRNIFIQKYTKDLKNKTAQSIQLFNEPIRSSEVSRTSIQNQGKFYLDANQVTDYGVKWLTNYQNDINVSEVRATKISDTKVMIIWAESNIISHLNGFRETGGFNYYYMIIDNNGSTVVEKTAITKSTPTNLIDYVYKDGYLYYSESDGNGNITLNQLDINNREEAATLESTNPDNITITDNKVSSYQLNVTSNKNNKIIWSSSNPNIATVDQNGLVKILRNGSVTITAFLDGYSISKSFKFTINADYHLTGIKFKQDNYFLTKGSSMNLLDEYVTQPINADNVRTISYRVSNSAVLGIDNQGNVTAKGNGTATLTLIINGEFSASCQITVGDYIKGDMNKNGKIDLTDILLLIKLYFNKIDMNDYYKVVGDMNSNDKIDLTDILLLIKTYFGKA